MIDRDRVLDLMDSDVTILTARALAAETAGMPGAGAILAQCASGIERAVALERTPPDVLFVSKEHLGRVQVRQGRGYFGVVKGPQC